MPEGFRVVQLDRGAGGLLDPHVTNNVIRHHERVREAMALLRSRKLNWAAAKRWAITSGGFKRADVGNVSLDVVERYIADLDSAAGVTA